MLCTWGPDVIRKKAWSFYRTISGVRLCWELEEPKGPEGLGMDGHASGQGRDLQGYLAHKKPPLPPRTTIGP